MRTLILFLILVNLAFYYWASQYESDGVMFDHPKTLLGYKPIKLLSEREQDKLAQNQQPSLANEQVSLAAQAKSNFSKDKCFSLGPFEQEQKSNEIYGVLFGSGIQAKQRAVNERRPKSYWVYLAAHQSQKDADKTVEFLKKNNIKEFYVWLAPPHKYAVSLGLFKKLKTAREKVDQISKLGLDPQMEVRFDEFTEYWVDFNHNTEAPQPKVIEEMLVKNDRMLILETKCL